MPLHLPSQNWKGYGFSSLRMSFCLRVVPGIVFVLVLASYGQANHEYYMTTWSDGIIIGQVVCSRERSYYGWAWSSWTYFTCGKDEYCCGDAWNRKCCKDSPWLDPDIAAILLTLSLIFMIVSTAVICGLLHRRKRTRHYIRLTDWWKTAWAPKIVSQQQPSMVMVSPTSRVENEITRTPRRNRAIRMQETQLSKLQPPTISISAIDSDAPNKSTVFLQPPPPAPTYSEYDI